MHTRSSAIVVDDDVVVGQLRTSTWQYVYADTSTGTVPGTGGTVRVRTCTTPHLQL